MQTVQGGSEDGVFRRREDFPSLGGEVQSDAGRVVVSAFSAQEAPVSFGLVYPAWCLSGFLASLVPKRSISITSQKLRTPSQRGHEGIGVEGPQQLEF